RFRAERLEPLAGGLASAPTVLHAQPDAAHEWRLVAITGRIERVTKLGDRWRAELAIGTRKIPIVGQSGSGIAASSMVEGRVAPIVGIVRRPFPTATDRRFGILPRSADDIRIDGGSIARQTAHVAGPAGAGGTATVGGGSTPLGAGAKTTATSSPPEADLADLATLVGSVVRVGGLVADLRRDGVLLDDGTTIGRVILQGAALELLPLLEPDDAINAIGRVEAVEDGPAVVVEDPAGISQAGDPQPPDAATPAGMVAASAAPGGSPTEAGLAGASPFGAGAVGFATLGALSAASLAVTLSRRWYLRRRLAARIATRLAGLETPPPAVAASRSAERGGNTIHSA
ncbi:MAG: hypothetical protein HY262_08065, partial [Chloroflexi bacterium]|nr:hypothetical protein [Chloroflexota bacterium]